MGVFAANAGGIREQLTEPEFEEQAMKPGDGMELDGRCTRSPRHATARAVAALRPGRARQRDAGASIANGTD